MMLKTGNYDIYHLGISGGKDSTAAFLWCVYESGWDLSKLVVSFCDTGNEDALTYEYVNMLSEIHPIERVHPPLDFWELARKKHRFPSARARFCTSRLKVRPSMKYIRELTERGNVLLLSGITKREGNSQNGRGELPVFGTNETFGLDQYLPIYNLNIGEIWGMHRRHIPLSVTLDMIANDGNLSDAHKKELTDRQEKHGIPRNPLYDMQATRVGCFPCIHSRKLEIRAMAKYRPDRIDFIEQQEVEVGKGRANNDISTFFHPKATTENFRSKDVIAKDGRIVPVPTIRDVVAWAHTSRGGKQFQMELAAFNDDPPEICDYRGMCE